MSKVKDFLTSVRGEIKRVMWPSPAKTAKSSAASVGIVVLSAIVLYAADKIAFYAIRGVLSLF